MSSFPPVQLPTVSAGESAIAPSPTGSVEDGTEVLSDEETGVEMYESETASDDEEVDEDAAAEESEATSIPNVSEATAVRIGWRLTQGRNVVVGGARTRIRMVEQDEMSIGNVLSLKGVEQQVARAKAKREARPE